MITKTLRTSNCIIDSKMPNDRPDYVEVYGEKEHRAQPNEKQQVQPQELVEVGEEEPDACGLVRRISWEFNELDENDQNESDLKEISILSTRTLTAEPIGEQFEALIVAQLQIGRTERQ